MEKVPWYQWSQTRALLQEGRGVAIGGLGMNQYSKDKGEAGGDTRQKKRQRCFFPGEAEQRFYVITEVMRVHLKVVTSSGGSVTCPQIKGIVSQEGTGRVRSRLEWLVVLHKSEKDSVYLELMRQCGKTGEATDGKTVSSCDLLRFPEHIPLHCYYPGSRCLDSLPCTLSLMLSSPQPTAT